MAPDITISPAEVGELNARFATASAVDLLRWAWDRFGCRAAIGTSFQGAGLVVMHLARAEGLGFPVFTLDTGLLFRESIALRRRLEAHFGISIEVLEPDVSVGEQTAAHGPGLWNRDPDLCCTIRKVLPLQSRLRSLDCWITGLRRDQSEERAAIDVVELYHQEAGGIREVLKLNPLAHWTRDAVWEFVRREGIPYNPLHDRGYRSIGCQPCTASGRAGEGDRAGRWVGFQKTECGIHTFMQRAG